MYSTRVSRLIHAPCSEVFAVLTDGAAVIVHEGIPDAVPRGDNEAGTRSALDRLARLVEAGRS